MTLLNPESLSWVSQLETVRALGPKASRVDRKKALNLSNALVSNIINLEACFDPAAIEKVRQAAKGNPPYILSSGSAKGLINLKKKGVADLHGSVHAALDVIFTHRLITRQILALVEWIISGKPASEFDPNSNTAVKPGRRGTKKDKADKGKGKDSPQSGILSPTGTQQILDLDKLGQLLERAKVEKALGKETTAQKKLLDYLQSILESAQSKLSSSKKKIQDNSNWVETVYLSWLAEVSLIKKIKSKVAKGQPVTRGEKALLWLHKFGEWTGWAGKHLFKLARPFLKLAKIIWKLLMEALEVLGLLKYIKAVLVIAAFVCFGWFAWEAWRYGPMHPMRLLEPYCFRKTEESPVQEAPTPMPVVSEPESKPKAAYVPKISKPAVVYQSSIAWQSTDEDQKLLDTEIAALPVNCIVKDFPLTPDEGMPGDLAVSRLQDLTDPDKYTMKIGQGTQKILSVNATATNLTINYKSTDLLGVFGSGPGQMNRFWEDVMMIHVDEIDIQGKNPKVIYQCSLITSDAKDPLTIQCSTPADLKHLVSTMEYFIRASRLAHDTALAGMPYPNQGLRLNNDCLVNVLWANSPANKSGLTLGDMVWSLDKNAEDQPDRKKLEAQLSALASGPHDFYIVSPTDRNVGLVQRNAANSNVFNPKRHKVVLDVL